MRAPHSTATMVRVRELHDADWTPTQMIPVLEREGHRVPSITTIYTWIDPAYAERNRVACRRRAARRTAAASDYRWPAKRSAEWRMERMRVLSEDVGMSFSAIARLMSHDFPDTPLTRSEVEDALRLERPPRSMRIAV